MKKWRARQTFHTNFTKEVKELMSNNELYKLHKELVYGQGRRISWIALQLNCSYSYVYQYLNGMKVMKQEKIDKIHSILVG